MSAKITATKNVRLGDQTEDSNWGGSWKRSTKPGAGRKETRPRSGAKMMRKMLTVSSLLLLAVAAAGCTSSGSSTPGKNASVIIMKDSGVGHYHPGTVEVERGGEVVWTNKSGVVHNVVFDQPSIQSSGLMKDGDTFSASFPYGGNFSYICTLHPTMKGSVVVD